MEVVYKLLSHEASSKFPYVVLSANHLLYLFKSALNIITSCICTCILYKFYYMERSLHRFSRKSF
jgi:hypothetical protein